MIRTMFILLTIILPIWTGASDAPPPLLKPHQTVYNHVIKNKPDLDPTYAENLSKAIYRASIKHRLNPLKVSAILRQESGYRLDAINRVTKDFSIGQINYKTIKAFNFDKNRLLIDLDYSVEAAIIVLADFKRMYGKREKNWYSRYNSSNDNKRKEYEQLVARYL